MSKKVEVEGRRLKGRPRKRWIKNTREDMRNKRLSVSDTQDRNKWQVQIQNP